MKKWTKWMAMTAVAGVCLLMTGCGASMPDSQMEQEHAAENRKENEVESVNEKGEDAVETENATVWSAEEKMAEVMFFEEHFGDGKVFQNMESDALASYDAAIGDAYDFIGRITEDGYGYVLGFKKGVKDPFEGYDSCWKNGVFTVTETEEKTGEEITAFTLPGIENIYFEEGRNILYIHPTDYEETENISIAFQKKFCSGENGRAYLDDVILHNVRFTAPDSGAYLAVNRLENGYWKYEYISLTEEEEERILQSDALILPEWYGKYGIEFFVSEERYEETGIECVAITDEALKIAEDRCHFIAMDLSEIKEIVKARFKMEASDVEKEIDISLTNTEVLQELEEIFSHAEVGDASKVGDASACLYTGIFTLIREDETELVLQLAMDGSNGFIYGSAGMYQIKEEDSKRVWEILGEGSRFIQ